MNKTIRFFHKSYLSADPFIIRRKDALKRASSRIVLALFLIGMMQVMFGLTPVKGWSNGGYSSDPQNPNYGTHDWIAQHALDWLPGAEKQFIVDNLAAYLYGTELPDNSAAPDGIGDIGSHHVYFNESEKMTDDWAAFRAQWEFDRALYFLKSGDLANASKTAGIMSHYLADVAVFGHVMAADTPWGAEVHHSDYESYVNTRTNSYDAEFNIYLSHDNLETISAYNATKNLAYDTTFDTDGDLNCTWMDQNYNWSDPTFKNRCGESLNLAVNYLADVLHTLYEQSTMGEENITVFPAGDVGVLFENATNEGSTTVNKTEVGPEPPPMQVVKQYYDIETTASYSENITVRIIYDIDPYESAPGIGKNLTPEEEKTLQLVHWNETVQQWENITTYIDRENNLITGNTTHLSMFGVTCKAIHDICITNVALSKTIIGQGYDHLINVSIKNEGNVAETFNITLQASLMEVEALTVNNLPKGTCITVTFIWNGTGLDYGDYIIVVRSLPVAGETDTSDNDFSVGVVKVTIPGDVNGDFELKREDIDILLEGFGSTLGKARWNIDCDINNDGKTDLGDIVIALDNLIL